MEQTDFQERIKALVIVKKKYDERKLLEEKSVTTNADQRCIKNFYKLKGTEEISFLCNHSIASEQLITKFEEAGFFKTDIDLDKYTPSEVNGTRKSYNIKSTDNTKCMKYYGKYRPLSEYNYKLILE
jgi:hypothetical protein